MSVFVALILDYQFGTARFLCVKHKASSTPFLYIGLHSSAPPVSGLRSERRHKVRTFIANNKPHPLFFIIVKVLAAKIECFFRKVLYLQIKSVAFHIKGQYSRDGNICSMRTYKRMLGMRGRILRDWKDLLYENEKKDTQNMCRINASYSI